MSFIYRMNFDGPLSHSGAERKTKIYFTIVGVKDWLLASEMTWNHSRYLYRLRRFWPPKSYTTKKNKWFHRLRTAARFKIDFSSHSNWWVALIWTRNCLYNVVGTTGRVRTRPYPSYEGLLEVTQPIIKEMSQHSHVLPSRMHATIALGFPEP